MTDEKKIELIDELADKCCRYHDMYKSCMACWKRTNCCDKYMLLYSLVERGCRVERRGEWLTDKYGMERSICSICGAVFEGDGGSYCRKCGAKMVED